MLVPVGVLIAVLFYYPRIPEKEWSLRVAAALILTGGLGNLIDRLRTAYIYAQDTGSLWSALPFVYVTDFFDIKIWPVWNVADMCVVSGTIILGLWLWRSERETPETDTGTDTGPITSDP